MIKQIYNSFVKNKKGEVNMIAIVLILLVVIILAVIFKDGLTNLLKSIFTRLENDINNFQ